MAKASDEERYQMLDKLVKSCTHFVCDIFKRRWKTETDEEWLDSAENFGRFQEGLCGGAFDEAQKRLLTSQDVEDWDMTMLSLVLFNLGSKDTYEKENGAVHCLKSLSNDLDYHSIFGKVTKQAYNEDVLKIWNSLKSLGMKDGDIDKLKKEVEGAAAPTTAWKRVKLFFDRFKQFARKRVLLSKSGKLYYKVEETSSVSSEEYQMAHKQEYINIPGEEDLIQGNLHYEGCGGRPQNYKTAVFHFQRAANKNNLSAMYNLAMCYFDGHGVKQDFMEGFRRLQGLAGMDMIWPGLTTPYRSNDPVGRAQLEIGRMYCDGIGVEVNQGEAAIWFEKAMNHCIGFGACNLGSSYHSGVGVGRYMKMAELCWREAANLKAVPVFQLLVTHYLAVMEPERAAEFFKFGRAMMNQELLKIPEKEFFEAVKECTVARDKLKEGVELFENVYKLSTKGMTLGERLDRMRRYSRPELTRKLAILKPRPISKKMRSEVRKRAKERSPTAKEYEAALECCSLLESLFERKTEFLRKEKIKILDVLYDFLDASYHLVPLLRSVAPEKIKCVLESMVKQGKCVGEGVVDMKLRLCYVAFVLMDPLENPVFVVELLKEGSRRYPNNVNYYIALSVILISLGKYEFGKYFAQEGLKREPENEDLLFAYAVLFASNTSQNTLLTERIAKFENFLNVAAPDHRMVPEAYYCMAVLHFLEILNEHGEEEEGQINNNGAADLEPVVAHLRQAKQSEELQLPCYLPYEKSSAVIAIESILASDEDVWGDNLKTKFLNAVIQDLEGKKGVLERKCYLKSPTRKMLIRLHRRDLRVTGQDGFRKLKPYQLLDPVKPPKLKPPSAVKNMCELRPIVLDEMNTTSDQIFEDRVIHLTILTEPHIYHRSSVLSSVAEDDNGDVTRLQIHNFAEEVTKIREKITLGRKIALINPYVQVESENQHNLLRVDDLKCLVYFEGVEKMCGFCGDANADQECSKCKRIYCSNECLELDWKMNDHELVCSSLKTLV